MSERTTGVDELLNRPPRPEPAERAPFRRRVCYAGFELPEPKRARCPHCDEAVVQPTYFDAAQCRTPYHTCPVTGASFFPTYDPSYVPKAPKRTPEPAQPKLTKPKTYARRVAETWLEGGDTPEALAAVRARLPSRDAETAALAESELIEELSRVPSVEQLAKRMATRFRDRRPDAKSPKRGARVQLDEGRTAAPEPAQDDPEPHAPATPELTAEQKRERADARSTLDRRALFYRERFIADRGDFWHEHPEDTPWARWARPLLDLAAQYRALDGAQQPDAEETVRHAERIERAMRKVRNLKKRGPKLDYEPSHPDWRVRCESEALITRFFKICRIPSLKKPRDSQTSREITVRERIVAADPGLYALLDVQTDADVAAAAALPVPEARRVAALGASP